MKVTCPSCRQAGVFDAAPEAALASVVCPLCETTYEAALVEGEVLVFIPPAAFDARPVAQVASEGPKGFHLNPFDDVLTIPQEPLDLPETSEQPLVLDELFLAPDPGSPAPEEVREPDRESAPVEARAMSEEIGPASVHVTELPDAEAGPEDNLPPHVPMAEPAPASYDKYAVGVRLLRLSPVWLLLAAAGFVGIIFLFSWLAGSAGEAEMGAPSPVLRNQATNQKAVPGPPSAGQRAAENPPKSGEETKIAEVTAPESVAAATTAESGDAEAGKFTVQVGSYNDASEANERVSNLRAAGFEARTVTAEIPRRGTWYRVQAGRFRTRDEASRYGAQLRAKGLAENTIIAEVEN